MVNRNYFDTEDKKGSFFYFWFRGCALRHRFNLIRLRKRRITANGTHKKTLFYTMFKFFFYKKLTTTISHQTGRNNTGTMTVYTKSKVMKRRYIRTLQYLSGVKYFIYFG